MKLITLLLIGFILPAFVSAQRYLFYLHGRIIEDQGLHAVDTVNGYGAYQYEAILDAFKKADFIVLSEVRPKNTNPFDYAHKIQQQVDSLIKKGVTPGNITIIGASKGSIISMFISSYLKNKNVNFVFMGGCDDEILERFPEIQFCGNILSIYEKTDKAGSCIKFKQRTKQNVPHYKEIELNTGLRHGYLYKALADWIDPSIEWANGKYEQPLQHKFSPKKEALILFNKYKPVIERKNNALVQDPTAIVGDINGDGKEDCVISYTMTSKDGGNAIIGHESAIYLNMGTSMKVTGAFPSFNFCYTLNHIKDQVIYAKEYECKPPYNTVLRERKFSYSGGKIKEVL